MKSGWMPMVAATVILVGCTPTSPPTTPAPTPTFMCTPEAGGAEAPCSQQDYDKMKAKDEQYAEAEKVVADTNVKVQQAADLMAGLRKDGVLTTPPFSQPIDFVYFDLWHYDGRTAKHGAFMGGADFVQWHGNYPMLARAVDMRAMADELRRRHGRP